MDQTSDDETASRLTQWAFSIDGVVERPSRASLPGAQGLTVEPGLLARDEAMIVGREFAHIHPEPGAGSLHLRLPAARASEVVADGWGEWHPFAVDGSVPGFVMVYAPRNDADLDAVKAIVQAPIEYAIVGASDQ